MTHDNNFFQSQSFMILWENKPFVSIPFFVISQYYNHPHKSSQTHEHSKSPPKKPTKNPPVTSTWPFFGPPMPHGSPWPPWCPFLKLAPCVVLLQDQLLEGAQRRVQLHRGGQQPATVPALGQADAGLGSHASMEDIWRTWRTWRTYGTGDAVRMIVL